MGRGQTVNFFEQVNWQAGREWRRVTEWLTYQFEQLLAQPRGEAAPGPDWLEPLVIWLTRVGLGILVLVLIYGLVRFLWPFWQRWRSPLPAAEEGQYKAIVPSRTIRQWLAQARMFHAQGENAAACRCLYMAMLLGLEQGEWLSSDPARTNREYLQRLDVLWQMGDRPLGLRAAVQQLFTIHDQIYYGGQSVTAETWERCAQAYQTLEPELLKPRLPQ